jgi:hypothetical protein
MLEPKRYAELSPVARAFIETLDDEKIVQMTEAGALIRDLSPEAKAFLRSSEPATLKWLERADGEKLKKVDAAIQFMSNAEFMGKWTWRGIFGFLAISGGFYTAFKFWKGG